ncbi:hypothetical protein D3C78_1105070 [compost metagenome]
MALRGEGELAVGTAAAVQILPLPAFHFIGVAALGRQAVDPGHDPLPLAAMGADAGAEQLVGDQVRDLVGHGLAQEVLAVFPVQLGVEAQAVFAEVGDAGLESAQAQTDLRARKAAVEMGFGLLVAGLDAGNQLFGHGGGSSRVAADYAQAIPGVQRQRQGRLRGNGRQSRH